jgi:hypothetical protein
MIRQVRSIAMAALVVACGSATPTTAPASPNALIQLRQAPADLGCDAMGVPYREVTFVIDPTAPEQVSALADTGAVLRTFWAAEFRGGPAAEKAVVGPAGTVVAVDGEVLAIPPAAWPRLHGYFVCPSSDALYILAADPV